MLIYFECKVGVGRSVMIDTTQCLSTEKDDTRKTTV
nr:MAG TPA: hypothetical protein [Caudoviricetes sp.]